MVKSGKMANNIIRVLKALIVSYVVTGLLLLVLTFILYKFKLDNTQIFVGVVIVYLVSNLLGGYIIGRITKEKKFVWGVIIGLTYFIVLSIVSFIATTSFYGSGVNAIIALISCTIGGMVGGMIS